MRPILGSAINIRGLRKTARAWRASGSSCLAIVPCDAPSKLFLERIAQFRVTAPYAEWNGVWSLLEK